MLHLEDHSLPSLPSRASCKPVNRLAASDNAPRWRPEVKVKEFCTSDVAKVMPQHSAVPARGSGGGNSNPAMLGPQGARKGSISG